MLNRSVNKNFRIYLALIITDCSEPVKAAGRFDFTQNISGKDYKVEGSFDLAE
ncbi:hypothetical protein D9M72_616950 [compost metagenome]